MKIYHQETLQRDFVHDGQNLKYTFTIEYLSGETTIELTEKEFNILKNLKQNHGEIQEKFIDDMLQIVLEKLIDKEKINFEIIKNENCTASFVFDTEQFKK